MPSSGTSEPRTRMVGGAPEVRWRSDALFSTTLSRMSAKSKFMPPHSSASPPRCLSGVRALRKPTGARLAGGERAGASAGRPPLARARDAGDLGDRRQAAADLFEPVL